MAPARIPALKLAAFAVPAAPLLALTLPSLVFLAPFYHEALGAPIATVSLIFLLARAFDVVVDPLLGAAQDRTAAPGFGRRRFWLLASTPALMAFIWLAFLGLGEGASPVLIGVAVLGLYASFGAMMIAHLSWAGELDPSYHGRTRTLSAMQLAGMVGYIAMLVAPVIATQGVAEHQRGFAAVHAMGWILLAALPVAVAICVLVVREQDALAPPHMSFKQAIEAIRTNISLRQVLIPDFLAGVAQGVSGSLFLFLLRYRLDLAGSAETLLLIFFAGGLVGVPLWLLLGRRLGKHVALQLAFAHMAFCFAVTPFLPPGDFGVAACFLAFAGLSQSAVTLLVRAMMADVVDEDTVQTGATRTGLFFGMMLTTTKLGLALGPLTYAVLGMFHFDARLGAANPPEAMTALTLLACGAPPVLCVLGILSVRNYRLTEARQTELRAVIDARSAPR